MSKPLDSCRATLVRIDAKLDELERSVRDYELHSCRIVADDNLQLGERLYRLKNVVEPPIDLSIDVTEIACLMRSALDHLMFQLVERANPGGLSNEQRESSQFPIPKDGKTCFDVSDSRKRRLNLDSDVWNHLDTLQLYAETNRADRPLAALSEIVNVAKHRFHNTLEAVVPKTLSAFMGTSGLLYDNHIGMHMTVGSVRIRAIHSVKASFEEDAVVYRIVPEKPTRVRRVVIDPADDFDPLDLTIRLYGVVDFGNDNASLLSRAQAVRGERWLPRPWGKYFEQLDVNVEVAQKIVFGPGSGIVENRAVLDTLKTIRDYLRHAVFADRGVIEGI